MDREFWLSWLLMGVVLVTAASQEKPGDDPLPPWFNPSWLLVSVYGADTLSLCQQEGNYCKSKMNC